MSSEPIDINSDFRACCWALETTNKSLFITGKAGTGKSTLLRFFTQRTKKKVVVLAPTGIAALNIGGQTIHSFFGFPPRPLQKKEIRRRKNRKIYQGVDMIIIDEASMVRADLLDQIDYFLRINGKYPSKPFGGIQLVFFGDLFQLPPVVATDEERHLFQTRYETPYFFSSDVFKQLDFQMIELREVYRQENRRFIRLLDAIRLRRMDFDDLDDLNERYIEDFEDNEFYITLSARNARVDEINEERLEMLQTESFSFLATVTGEVPVLPADSPLKLKLGAQVMFLKNDTKKRYVNGTIGVVCEIDMDSIKVEILTPKGTLDIINVERYEWEVLRYAINEQGEIEAKVIGTFNQYPLRLAWAMTIHKSQGKTFDRIVIDMGQGGAFEFGQTYVALSRCRTLDGIVLKRLMKPQDVLVDERIVEFYQQNF